MSPRSPNRKRAKWKAAEGQLAQKKQEMDKAKVSAFFINSVYYVLIFVVNQMQDAIKRYSYLLGQTELFKHFVDMKVSDLPLRMILLLI